MNNPKKDVITYIKKDKYSYFVYKNGKKTDKEVNSFCCGCEENQPNQLAHYDGCFGEDYYNDGRYDIYYSSSEEEEEEKDSDCEMVRKRMKK